MFLRMLLAIAAVFFIITLLVYRHNLRTSVSLYSIGDTAKCAGRRPREVAHLRGR